MFEESERVLQNLTRMAYCLRKDADEGHCLDEEFPVFLMQIVYQGALATIEIGQGNPDEELKQRMSIFKWLLQHLQSRWRVAGKLDDKSSHILNANILYTGIYLSILQSKEAVMASVA